MENTILTVLGRKGSGKTTLVREIAEAEPRVIALDTIGEYGEAHGFHVVWGWEVACNVLVKVHGQPRFRLSCRDDNLSNLLKVLEVAYEVPDCMVVVEETSFFCSPSFLPDEISRMVRYGRHRRISQVYVSRRAAEVSRELTAQSDLIVSFQQREPRDVEYLAAASGVPARELVQEFARLPKYHCLVWGEVEAAPLPVLERMVEPSRPRQLPLPLDTEKGADTT